MLIRFSTFTGVLDKMPVGKIEAWDVFSRRFAHHTVQPAKPDGKQAKGALWSPTVYAPGETRGAAGVELVTCFVADIDDGTDWNELLPNWAGFVWALHSSFSSTSEKTKWRAVFPLKKAVPASAWASVWAKLNRELMGGHCDAATKDPSRIYFWPSCPESGLEEAFAYTNDGEEDVFLDHTIFTDPEVVKPTPSPRVPSAAVAGDVSSAKLLEKYIGLARPGGRNRTAFDLALQLRDNAFSAGEALACLADFKAAMGADFGDDMEHIWEQANNRAARQPWTKQEPRPKSMGLPSRNFVKAEDDDFMGAVPTVSGSVPGESYITEKWTDVGNKERFLTHFADQIRFDPTRGWMVWDGKRWEQDVDGGTVLHFGVMVARSLYEEEEPSDEKQCQLWRQFVKASNQAGKIRSFLDLAKSDPRIRASASTWDSDTMVINCQNGILDLRTGTLREHDPLAYCTYITRASYDKDAVAALWEKCLATWQPEEEIRGYLQRFSGYNLTGETGEQVVAFHFGDGGNGKSIYTSMEEFALGDYATRVPFAVLTDDKPRGGQASPDIARLAGRRMVIGSEIIGGRGFNESLIKDLTGGDVIIARHLHASPFEFVPKFKLTLYGNHKPQIRNQDEGIWRRLPLIEWGVTIPQEDRDKHLLTKLQAEVDGIFAWMVAGCLAWQESGLGTPQAVVESSASYREEQDQIGKFIRECCVVRPGVWASTKEIRAAYDTWCEDNGEKWHANPNQFSERLRREGGTPAPVRKVAGKAVRGWDGIAIAYESDELDMAEPTGEPQKAQKVGLESTKVTPQNPPLHLPVTPVTPKPYYTYARTRTHTLNKDSGVTGVTDVTSNQNSEKEPGDFQDNPPPKADHDPSDTTAVRVYEKALIEWTRRDFNSGKLGASSASQAAVWAKLESELEELRVLHETPGRAEEAKAAEPELRARMVTLAAWWRRTCPLPATNPNGRGK